MLRSNELMLASRQTVGATTTSPTLNLTHVIASTDRIAILWRVYAAERDTANETYNLYIQSGCAGAFWDVVHFPQVATIGVKTFVAIVDIRSLLPSNVTNATPGVSAIDPSIFQIDTAGSLQGTRTLAAGRVRHGVICPDFRWEMVVAGTVATGIEFDVRLVML